MESSSIINSAVASSHLGICNLSLSNVKPMNEKNDVGVKGFSSQIFDINLS